MNIFLGVLLVYGVGVALFVVSVAILYPIVNWLYDNGWI